MPVTATLLESVRYDLGFAVRGMRRRPGFTAIVVATFALGIGANTTMFGILDRLLFRAPPHIADPERGMLASQTRGWTLGARVISAFGALALLLAAGGLFSVVAFTTGQRMHEFGVRSALGAQPGDLLRLAMARGLAPAALGIGACVVVTVLCGRLVAPLLFQTSPYDAAVLSGASAALLVAAVVASAVPAMRATKVDPTIALRAE